MMSNAYQEGWDAFHAGKATNPYLGTDEDEAADWDDGWQDALDEEIEEEDEENWWDEEDEEDYEEEEDEELEEDED